MSEKQPFDTVDLPPSRRDVLRYMFGLGGAGILGVSTACSPETISPSDVPPSTTIEPTLPPTPSKSPEVVQPKGEFSDDPTWIQDFTRQPNGPVDARVWRHELNPEVPGYNDEEQAYTNHAKNVRIENGALIIEAHREGYSYPNDPDHNKYEFTSGRIDTLKSFNFTYGKIEVTMKLPNGEGTWPAFWLLSANQPHTSVLNPTEADWAQPNFYKKDGELDIMEAYGNRPNTIEGTVHTYKNVAEGHVNVPDADDAFHTYGVELTPTEIVWTIDAKPYKTYKKPAGNNPDAWPFTPDNELYMILNLAMGSVAGEVDNSQNSWKMAVKKVAFYEYTAQ